MKKLLLLFALTTALPLGRLLAVPNSNGGTTGQEPVIVRLGEQPGNDRKLAAKRADAGKQGVTATLQYVQLPDMKKARQGHQTFVNTNHLYVIGGNTTGHQPTATAERITYTNSSSNWIGYDTKNAHSGACTVKRRLGDTSPTTGYLICGGTGQIVETCAPNYLIFGVISGFKNGPKLSTPRTNAKGIYVNRKTYISGNNDGDDSTMDLLEEGDTAFKPVGKISGHRSPYMFADSLGRITVLSRFNNYGYEMDYKTFDDGSQALKADRYDPSSDKTEDVWFPFSPNYFPMKLPVDANTSDYSYTDNGHRISFILCQQLTQDNAVSYRLLGLDMDELNMTSYNSFIIPTNYEATGKYITWRGSVIVNKDRQEVYLIGASGPETNQTLHIISFNYDTENWTIASAGGFAQDLLSSSWTLLDDGRIACTGGYANTTTDQEHAHAYIFNPPVAGTTTPPSDGDNNEEEAGDHVVIENTSGETVSFLLSEDPHFKLNGQTVTVTTADVTIDYQTDEIARVYLTKSVPTGIDISELPANDDGHLTVEAGRIVVTGLQPGEPASVYQLSGELAATMKADQEGRLVISIDELPAKVSIIKTKHQSFKIIRK